MHVRMAELPLGCAPMQMTQTPRLLALVLVGAFAIAACGGSDAGSADDPCEAAQKLSDAFEAGDAAESEEAARAALGNFATALEDFAAAAPDDIKADAELLASGTRQIADVPEGEQPSDEVAAILGDEEYDAAGDRLEEFLGETCSIEL